MYRHRRTGITLREGKRDEHGMEEIEGMFSSPEKSPANENGFYHDAGNEMGSDGMSIDEGTPFFSACLFPFHNPVPLVLRSDNSNR